MTPTPSTGQEPEIVQKARREVADPYTVTQWRIMWRHVIEAYELGLQATLARPDSSPRERFCSGPCKAQRGSTAWEQCPTGNTCNFDDPNRGWARPDSGGVRDALENLVIAIGMGWDPDGCVGVATAALLVSPKVEGPTEHPQAPPGYVVVPEEPTPEQVSAGSLMLTLIDEGDPLDEHAVSVYVAMLKALAARPVLPEPGGE